MSICRVLVKYMMVPPGTRAGTGGAAGPDGSAGCSVPSGFLTQQMSSTHYIRQGAVGKTETTRSISTEKT